ncbi:hypothetical protein LB505_011123 [Fusarium chuoi]|nr:hypothetical protein LB505_011123 [Fusarium chuoi]
MAKVTGSSTSQKCTNNMDQLSDSRPRTSPLSLRRHPRRSTVTKRLGTNPSRKTFVCIVRTVLAQASFVPIRKTTDVCAAYSHMPFHQRHFAVKAML